MQLTPPTPLTKGDSTRSIIQDVLEIAHVDWTTLSSSENAALRYGKIPKTEAIRWLVRRTLRDLEEGLRIDRIATTTAIGANPADTQGREPREIGDRGDGREQQRASMLRDRYEHVVVRDLDLPRLWESDDIVELAVGMEKIHDESVVDEGSRTTDDQLEGRGRVVAHAEFQFHSGNRPPHSHDIVADSHTHAHNTLSNPEVSVPGASTSSSANDSTTVPLPLGINKELFELFNSGLFPLLDAHIARLTPCFELNLIATSDTHLRQGIARQLLTWIFPFADAEGVPVVLAASPVGVLLYKKCGFVEIGDVEDAQTKLLRGEFVMDNRAWGGKDIHRHVFMVRWPANKDGGNSTRADFPGVDQN